MDKEVVNIMPNSIKFRYEDGSVLRIDNDGNIRITLTRNTTSSQNIKESEVVNMSKFKKYF